jgi:hypothetical protein
MAIAFLGSPAQSPHLARRSKSIVSAVARPGQTPADMARAAREPVRTTRASTLCCDRTKGRAGPHPRPHFRPHIACRHMTADVANPRKACGSGSSYEAVVLFWELDVAGSNPATPTTDSEHLRRTSPTGSSAATTIAATNTPQAATSRTAAAHLISSQTASFGRRWANAIPACSAFPAGGSCPLPRAETSTSRG